MDWFLCDNGLHHERVNDIFFCFSKSYVVKGAFFLPQFCSVFFNWSH